jgi:hypothetical protein
MTAAYCAAADLSTTRFKFSRKAAEPQENLYTFEDLAALR